MLTLWGPPATGLIVLGLCSLPPAPQAPEFLWLLNTTELGWQAFKPGYLVVMLVPHDDAVRGLLKKLGAAAMASQGLQERLSVVQ